MLEAKHNGGKHNGGGRGLGGFFRGRGKHNGKGRGGKKTKTNDIGCNAGDPNNRLLPWVPPTLESLPNADILGKSEQLLANVTLPAWQRRPMRKCAIVVDRHVHKNGGSTVRDLFLEHERTGHALYQGYTQMYWHRDYRVLRRAAETAIREQRTPEHVLLIEAHFGWVEMEQSVLPSLRELSKIHKQNNIDCPLVLMTRVREPLDYYLSFYRWGVAFRQREDPASFGSNFLEWARRVPNLQSTMMVQSMAAMAAEYHINQYMMNYNRRRPGAAIGNTEEAAWHKLMAFLDQFTIVGTMKRFDESLLLAHDLVGLPILLYKRNRPNQKGGYRGTNKDVCPDMEACREEIRKIAGRDYKMFNRYNASFEKKLEELGPEFARRVQAYKQVCEHVHVHGGAHPCQPPLFSLFLSCAFCCLLQAIAEIQSTWKKVPRKQYICRYHPETTTNVRELRPHNIRCPVKDGGTELCQSVYAHRLFECPWQYVPNSTLSDPLGCWRPSSGFK